MEGPCKKDLSQLVRGGANAALQALRKQRSVLGRTSGQLQFEVRAFRLQDEYSVQCVFEQINVGPSARVG